MSIERDIFDRYVVDKEKLIEYGFTYKDNLLVYSKTIMNDEFMIVVEYDKDIVGKVIDLSFNEEYTNFRLNRLGDYAADIKNEFINVLCDIRDHCTHKRVFIYDQPNIINDYIFDTYGVKPAFLFAKDPHLAIYRNSKDKWFAVIMHLPIHTVNKSSDSLDTVEVMNIKIKPDRLEDLLKVNGIYEAYHMNKKHWISVVLDGSIDNQNIFKLIDQSYTLINKK